MKRYNNWIDRYNIYKSNVENETTSILKFFISLIFILLFNSNLTSQTEQDSLITKNKYGIRIGLDISKQIRMLTEEYNGLSLYGDIKIKERLFIVAEVGRDNKNINNENLKSKFSGNYIKTGLNYNLYNNLPGLKMKYVGFRGATSKFESEVFEYNTYNRINIGPKIEFRIIYYIKTLT